MKGLILHDTTREQLDRFMASPSHALLLVGPSGIGKTAIAESLAEEILATRLASHPYHLTVQPDGASISIEAIRQLQKFLQLKTIGNNTFRRSVIVEHAHTLTTEAQNAFLKLLEEPPADTLIILTATTPRSLLPTIVSRTQTIAVAVPPKEQLRPLMTVGNKNEQAREQAYFLSDGLPGLLCALLSEESDHPLLASVAQAKEILQKQPFERLAMADVLSKDKNAALGLAEALERIAQAGLAGAGAKQNLSRVKQWHKVRKAALKARDALKRSANAKLVLDDLFLSI